MKSTASVESDARASAGTGGHIHPPGSDGIGARIASILGEETQASFAKRCGFGESTLRNYLGGADPSASRLVAMARAANVSVEWLATGKESKVAAAPAPAEPPAASELTDRDRLVTAIRAVEQGLALIGRTMAPDKKAELILAAYELISQDDAAAQATQSAKIIQFIKLAA